MCCSFNLDTSPFRDSLYSSAVESLQKETTDDSMLKKGPNSLVPKVGKGKGLTLILDGHSNLVSASTVAEDFNGFLAFVGPRTNFPMLTEGGVLIKPGHENFVEVSAIKISSDPAVR